MPNDLSAFNLSNVAHFLVLRVRLLPIRERIAQSVKHAIRLEVPQQWALQSLAAVVREVMDLKRWI